MKIVIIGCSGHVEYALASEEFNIAAFAPGSADEECDLFFKEKLEIRHVMRYEDYHAMLESEHPDLAVINPHYDLNGKITIQCLKHGIHCFTEKPLSLVEEELDEIEAILKDTNSQLCTMMHYRYHAAFFAAYTAVVSGVIGDPLLFTAQKSYKMGEKPKWMQNKEKFGGIIPWVGSHPIDLIHWMSEGKIINVSASSTTKGNHNFGGVESSATLMMQLTNGGNATINLDYFRPESAPTFGDDRIRVAGEKGSVEVIEDKAYLITNDSNKEQLGSQVEQSLFKAFIDQIEKNVECRVSSQDAIDVARICIAANKSAETHTMISL